MAPEFVICAILTAAVLLAGWYLGLWPGRNWTRSIIQLALLGLWVCELLLWALRVVGINYRLTTRTLYVDQGFREPMPEGIALDSVQQVVVEQGILERWLGLGRILIVRCSGGRPPTILLGVAEPDQVASLIRAQVERSRKKSL
jgi:hypothetical protein